MYGWHESYMDLENGKFIAPLAGTYEVYFQCLGSIRASGTKFAYYINGKAYETHGYFANNVADSDHAPIYFKTSMRLDKGDVVTTVLVAGALHLNNNNPNNNDPHMYYYHFGGELISLN